MTFNDEIKELVKIREEMIKKEFEIIVRRCLDILKKEKRVCRVFIFTRNTYIGVIANFSKDINSCLIEKYLLPIIDDKYFFNLDNEEMCFDNFLCDFEYYLYMNTIF